MKNLKDRIKKSGLKKKYIAEQVGIDPATLSRIIAGKQSYTSEELVQKINDLLDGKAKK